MAWALVRSGARRTVYCSVAALGPQTSSCFHLRGGTARRLRSSSRSPSPPPPSPLLSFAGHGGDDGLSTIGPDGRPAHRAPRAPAAARCARLTSRRSPRRDAGTCRPTIPPRVPACTPAVGFLVLPLLLFYLYFFPVSSYFNPFGFAATACAAAAACVAAACAAIAIPASSFILNSRPRR